MTPGMPVHAATTPAVSMSAAPDRDARHTADAFASGLVDAPVERVWALVRAFAAEATWHPLVAASSLEGGKDGEDGPGGGAGAPADAGAGTASGQVAGAPVGAVRVLRLRDGATLRERLVAASDDDHTLTYRIEASPLPVTEAEVTIRLRPLTAGASRAGRTFVEIRGTFTAGSEVDAQAAVAASVAPPAGRGSRRSAGSRCTRPPRRPGPSRGPGARGHGRSPRCSGRGTTACRRCCAGRSAR
jgi:hypothetical protein